MENINIEELLTFGGDLDFWWRFGLLVEIWTHLSQFLLGRHDFLFQNLIKARWINDGCLNLAALI